MNRFERNHAKIKIEGLKLKNLKLTSGQIIWGMLGIATLPTLIGPYSCYGYIRQYSKKKNQNKEQIKELKGNIGKSCCTKN